MIDIQVPLLNEQLNRVLGLAHGFSVISTVLLDQLNLEIPPGIFYAFRQGLRDASVPDLLAKVWSDPNDPSNVLQFYSRKDPQQMQAELVNAVYLQRISYGVWYIMTHNFRLAQLFDRLEQGVVIPITRRLRWFIEKNQPGLIGATSTSVVFRPQFIVSTSIYRYRFLLAWRIERAVMNSLRMVMPTPG